MLKKVCLGLALSWTGIILYLCLVRLSGLPAENIPNVDKYVHAFFYFVFSLLWFLTLHFYFKNQNRRKLLGIVFFVSLFFGIMIELFQTFFTLFRNGDVADVLANTTGALLAIFVIKIVDKNGFLDKIKNR